ncbi:Ger(x)C family spore germination protein [Heyndrickxia coagulans]|uniref:Germination protein, Ger(X)C family n=1 Tax=Heyndrickxia coagulans 36D1 TaxID=345219 RepID=G2TKJ2_HEYCO|nr:Ger(x)C family spore germination protein [Heyndrickxia coagulans]AEP01484.1 germination protein, Ger(x)C family [Heyndrickxia coagulans 36D1]
MRRRRWKTAVALFTASFLLAGCWSHKELTDIAFVSAIGIDRLENGNYLLTYQIVNSLNIPSGMQTSGGQGPPVTIYQTEGKTIEEAILASDQEISRRLYFSHTNVLLIGRNLAENGIYPVIDTFDRRKEFRNTASVLIARKGKAEDILQVMTPIDHIPTNKINKTLEDAEENVGGRIKTDVSDILYDFTTEGKEAVVGSFKLMGDPKKGGKQESQNQTKLDAYLTSGGIGILKHGKLIDWVGGQDARTITWLLKKTKMTSLEIDWAHHPRALGLQVRKTIIGMKPVMKNGKPEMHIHIRLAGQLQEVDVPLDVMDSKEMARIEKAYEKNVEQQINKGIRHMQREQCDVFGFGEMIYRQYPKEWHSLKHHWNENGFAHLKVKVHANVVIANSGIRTNPFHSNLK